MRTTTIEVRKQCGVSADAAWGVASDFCGNWHPAYASIAKERDKNGALIRCFMVKGENTVYREQLTYFSDSGRELAYICLQGIADAEHYSSRCKITAMDKLKCEIVWSANFRAHEPRASQIAEGTRHVFEIGIEAIELAAKTKNARSEIEILGSQHQGIELILDSAPRLAITLTEAKSGPLCVFLHGIGGRRQNWNEQLNVAGHFMQSAALDLRGYGDSELGISPSTVEDYCSDILRVMAALKKDQVVLCGLSYGSWIATSFAMRYPGKLKGLILSGGCTGMSEAQPQEREAFRNAREVPLNEGKTPADFATAVVDLICGPQANQETRNALQESMAAIPAATYRDAVHCFTMPTEKFDFSKIISPVLLITGSHDCLATPAEIGSIAQRIHDVNSRANVRFEVIENAGHVCNIEAPQQYNQILAQFLAGLNEEI